MLTAIDIDNKNTDYLERKFKNKNIKIICGDILDFDYSKLIDGITIFWEPALQYFIKNYS